MNLADPGTLKAFLGRHGLTAKKGLGQHFLCSAKAVSAIEAAFEGYRGLVEIGPGPGVLTSPLSQKVEKMIALELDDAMIEALKESAPTATVVKQDALKADLATLLKELPEPRGIVSNLPYYITGPLLTRVAEARAHYGKAILMMQKEVAQRVMAKPRESERGSLSVYLQMQFTIRVLSQVPAGAFVPPPKVDSTVLEFVPLPDPVTDHLQRLVRLGFAQPRKTLVNNLVAGFHITRDEALATIHAAGLGDNARPQELSLDEWKGLSKLPLPLEGIGPG